MTESRCTTTRRLAALAAAAFLLVAGNTAPARAQEPPIPHVGPWVIDLHGTFFLPPSNQQLAASRGLVDQSELPGLGLGADAALHVYPLHWKAVTLGIGGRVVAVRSHSAAAPLVAEATAGVAVTETFVAAAPELSFNFRGSNGWSYISGGIGQSQWQIVADGQPASAADTARLHTVNYGGGARWFIRKHLAFSLDVRIWQLNPGQPQGTLPGSPRANLLLMSAGLSMK